MNPIPIKHRTHQPQQQQPQQAPNQGAGQQHMVMFMGQQMTLAQAQQKAQEYSQRMEMARQQALARQQEQLEQMQARQLEASLRNQFQQASQSVGGDMPTEDVFGVGFDPNAVPQQQQYQAPQQQQMQQQATGQQQQQYAQNPQQQHTSTGGLPLLNHGGTVGGQTYLNQQFMAQATMNGVAGFEANHDQRRRRLIFPEVRRPVFGPQPSMNPEKMMAVAGFGIKVNEHDPNKSAFVGFGDAVNRSQNSMIVNQAIPRMPLGVHQVQLPAALFQNANRAPYPIM